MQCRGHIKKPAGRKQGLAEQEFLQQREKVRQNDKIGRASCRERVYTKV